jgi:sugar-phosphatase
MLLSTRASEPSGEGRRAAGCKVLATTFSHTVDQLAAADWIVESLAKVKITILPDDQGLELEFVPLSKTPS